MQLCTPVFSILAFAQTGMFFPSYSCGQRHTLRVCQRSALSCPVPCSLQVIRQLQRYLSNPSSSATQMIHGEHSVIFLAATAE